MDIKTIMQIFSLIGSFFIVVPFVELSRKRLESTSFTYNLLNFIGAVFLGINAVYNNAIGFIILEIIWGWVAFKGMIDSFKNPKELTSENN